jgi:MFS family permease
MYYRTARVVSMLGSRMTSLAGPLLVLGMGGGAVLAGAVGTCWFFAQMAFQLPAGHLADRFDQRRLMLAMDAVRLVAIGSVPLGAALGFLTFAQILVVVLIESAASVVFTSAAQVFLRVVVPRELFARAASQSQFSAGVISVVGPVLGGMLYVVDEQLPFVVDCASYAVSMVLLLAVSARVSDERRAGAGDEPVDGRVTAGLRWLWRRPPVMRLVLFGTALNLVGAASGVAVLVVLTESGVSAGVTGTVLGWSGAGVILGSMVAPYALKLGRWLYPLTGLLWSVALVAVAVEPSPWVIGAVLTFLAFLGPSVGVMLFQILRETSPLDLFGRVVAAEQLISSSLAVAAPLLTGALLAVLGNADVWYLFAVICLIAAAITVQPLPGSEAPAAENGAETAGGTRPAGPAVVKAGS